LGDIRAVARTELGYADYLGALQRYRLGAMNDTRLLTISISIRASEMSLHPPFWSVCQVLKMTDNRVRKLPQKRRR